MPPTDAKDLLRRLFEHLDWADQRAVAALRQTPHPPSDALEIFSHVLGSEHTWLSRLRQQQPTLAVWPGLDADACARQASENAAEIRAWVDELSADELSRQIRYTNSMGETYAPRVDNVLMHMCLHGAYHRGQVALLLRRNGLEPVPTDYIAFARGERIATGG